MDGKVDEILGGLKALNERQDGWRGEISEMQKMLRELTAETKHQHKVLCEKIADSRAAFDSALLSAPVHRAGGAFPPATFDVGGSVVKTANNNTSSVKAEGSSNAVSQEVQAQPGNSTLAIADGGTDSGPGQVSAKLAVPAPCKSTVADIDGEKPEDADGEKPDGAKPDGVAPVSADPVPGAAHLEKADHHLAGRGGSTSSLKEDLEHMSAFQRVVHGPMTTFLCALVVFNCFLMFGRLQFAGYNGADSLGRGPGFNYVAVQDVLKWIENTLVIIFLAEIPIRIAADRMAYFHHVDNYLDAGIAISSSTDLFSGGGKSNLGFLRFFRVLRVVRGMKALRVSKQLRHLRVIQNTCTSSFASLVWSMILLTLVISLASIFATQLLQPIVLDETVPIKDRIWIFERFGTSTRAFWTMFECTLSAAWVGNSRMLIERVHWLWSFFWFFYASTISFAMIRIVGALFLKETLASAACDTDTVVAENMKKKIAFDRKLKDLMAEIDTSGEGLITFDELANLVTNPHVHAYFTMLKLKVSDADALWASIPHTDPTCISNEEFVSGVQSLKAGSAEQDTYQILQRTRQILENQHAGNQQIMYDLQTTREQMNFLYARALDGSTKTPLLDENSGVLMRSNWRC